MNYIMLIYISIKIQVLKNSEKIPIIKSTGECYKGMRWDAIGFTIDDDGLINVVPKRQQQDVVVV